MADNALKNYALEVSLNGVFTTVDVYLEGREIGLREVDSGKYILKINDFPIEGTLDITGLLKGWPGMDWVLEISVDGEKTDPVKGSFDRKNKGVMAIPNTSIEVPIKKKNS